MPTSIIMKTHDEARAWLEARGFDAADLERGKGKWRASPLTTAVILMTNDLKELAMYYNLIVFVKTLEN
jgi:hypothetical protein